MTSRAVSVVWVALAGCASAHRLVAPLAYDQGNAAAARSDEAFGAPPSVPPAPLPACIDWKKLTLSNGIRLFVAERHAFPSAAVRIVLTTGATASSDFEDGNAKRLDLLAATYLTHPDFDGDVSAQCTRASCWIGERTSAAETGEALGHLASWVTQPQGDARHDVHRFRVAIDSLGRREGSQALTLKRNAEVMAFGRPFAGSHARPALEPTIADVIRMREQLFRPAAATIVVAGDVSVAEVQAQAERAFGGWRSDREASPPAASSRESSDPPFVPRVVYVPDNSYPLALAAIVVRGPASSRSDVWAFRVATQILGGGIESELYIHVREELAAAYVSGAEVQWFPRASIATVGAYLERGKVIAATRVMLASVRALREKGPGLEAFDRAKARLKAQLYGSVSNWLLAASLEVTRDDEHPLDPCEATARIDAVTPDDVRAVMRVYFAEKRLGAVVIARDDQLDAWPADLDMGPVQRRDWLGQDLP